MNRLRHLIATSFLPALSFWQSWLTDVIIDDDTSDVNRLFDLSMQMCPHKDLTADYLEYMTRKYDEDIITEEVIRAALEKCVQFCGTDIYDSQGIWKTFRDLEVDEYAELEADGEVGSVSYTIYTSLFLLTFPFTTLLTFSNLFTSRLFPSISYSLCAESPVIQSCKPPRSASYRFIEGNWPFHY